MLATGEPVSFSYRCDSPECRREMNITLSRSGDQVFYESVVVREIDRPVPLPLETDGAPLLVVMCSFCKDYRFPVESPDWKDLDLLLTERELPASFSISHGICDACFAKHYPDIR